MAPGKFGLFKGRSRECAEPPSTENLLSCSDLVVYPVSPLPSTSQGLFEAQLEYRELSMLHLDSDDEDESVKGSVTRRCSDSSKMEEAQITYNRLPSTNTTSTTTLQDSLLEANLINDEVQDADQKHGLEKADLIDYDLENYDCETVTPDDATSVDAHSIQFDQQSLFSADIKYCGASKKQRRHKAKEEQKIQEQNNDSAMWQASNYEVLQHLLARSGSLDEQIKWEAIATARGLCTLTAQCSCGDCSGVRAPTALTDGDAGMGAAPLLGASLGCRLM